MPANSPASLPTFSGEYTHTPTSSRSGRRLIASIAIFPTPPVDHTTTRTSTLLNRGPGLRRPRHVPDTARQYRAQRRHTADAAAVVGRYAQIQSPRRV